MRVSLWHLVRGLGACRPSRQVTCSMTNFYYSPLTTQAPTGLLTLSLVLTTYSPRTTGPHRAHPPRIHRARAPGALPQGADEPDAGAARHRTAAAGHAAQEGGQAPLTSTHAVAHARSGCEINTATSTTASGPLSSMVSGPHHRHWSADSCVLNSALRNLII